MASRVSLMGWECGITLVAMMIAFGWPTLGSNVFSTIETAFASIARRPWLAVVLVTFAAFSLRIAIIPICPTPRPFVPDDFSFLLAADTFASGRLTNATPQMWTHLESIHVSMFPTYGSMYFPAQGLLLAASLVLAGNAWVGILIMGALMCGAICWALQAWMPPTWALLGGIIAILRINTFSYWTNTYHTAAAITAFAGALIIGAMPRLFRTAHIRYAFLMAFGASLLVLSRPYEGLLVGIPVCVATGKWLLSGKNRPRSPFARIRLLALPAMLLVVAIIWLGYYDYRAFGSPLTLPYTVNRSTYAVAPYFVWQSPRPEPKYRDAVMRTFYCTNEMQVFNKLHGHFVRQTVLKPLAAWLFFSGFAFLPVIFMTRRVLLDRRTVFLLYCLATAVAGMLLQVFLLTYYLAPFVTVIYALGLQGLRHLRLANVDGRPVGLGLVRMSITICFVLAGMRLAAAPLHLTIPEWPPLAWNVGWCGPSNFGLERAHVEEHLARQPGEQIALVQYSPNHNPLDEWVYNSADVDHSKVIWAISLTPDNDSELLRHYPNRTSWLIEPDAAGGTKISPYSGAYK